MARHEKQLVYALIGVGFLGAIVQNDGWWGAQSFFLLVAAGNVFGDI